MSVALPRCRSALIIVSSAVLALAFASSQSSTAQAQMVASTGECDIWIDVKTGEKVPTGPYGWAPINGHNDVTSPNHRHFTYLPDGSWIDVKTGEKVPTGPYGWAPINGHNDVTSPNHRHFAWVPCPPRTQTSGLYLGGHPVLVLGGNVGGGWSRNTYSDFPTFDGSGAGGGVYGAARFYVQPNFFVGPEAGFMLLDINARNPDSAFGFVRTDAYLGGQAGVTVQGPGASKINVYTGLDADWSRITVGVETADERMSKILGGWSVHGGVELQPIPSIPTMWLGLDVRHSDVGGTIGGDPTHVRWNMLSLTLSIQH